MTNRDNKEGNEKSLYYLGRTMTPNEVYFPIEELYFSIQKMKHYFQAHVIRLFSRENPIRFALKI